MLTIDDGTESHTTSPVTGQWKRVDLGAARTIASFRALNSTSQNNRPWDWKLQYSNDDATWTDLVTGLGDATEVTRTFAPTTARYWRLYATWGGSGGWGLLTFELREAEGAGAQASVAYRGDGLRHSRTAGGTATFTWDVNAGLPVVLQDGTYSYVYGATGLISQTNSSGTQAYFLADGLGSTAALTDGAGTVTATFKYDVFGAVRSSTGTGSSEFRFTGQQEDAATGLMYLRARYYDPTTGRFLSKDPYRGHRTNPASQNRYVYTYNNPVNFVDPRGLETEEQYLGRVAHWIIRNHYLNKHPGALPEYCYSVSSGAGYIDIVDFAGPAPDVAWFWEIKKNTDEQRAAGRRQVALRMRECTTAEFFGEYGFVVRPGEDYEGLNLTVQGWGLRAWKDSNGLIVYEWTEGDGPLPYFPFQRFRRSDPCRCYEDEHNVEAPRGTTTARVSGEIQTWPSPVQPIRTRDDSTSS